jgi:histidinol-phosphatase (PHP family)
VLDYHLHLWPHGQREQQPTIEQLAAYCEQAAARGITEIALTEHLFRFRQADRLEGHWDADTAASPELRAHLAAYWDEHNHADLDTYVEAVLEAKAAGLPVVLGLEVDHYRDRMHEVADVLAGYPWDVLLGSVHWLGSWGFDILEDDVPMREWDVRAIDDVWDAYTEALEELADSRVCDVLAHPDLCKITGRMPAVPEEFYDRMAEAAAASGMAAEVSTAGWRKPIGEPYPAPALLRRFRDKGVGITTASDAHAIDLVADRNLELRPLIEGAGYTSLRSYRQRVGTEVEL